MLTVSITCTESLSLVIESRGGLVLSFDQGPIESGIERTTPTSAEEWKEIVESEWADWKSFPDMRYLSDEAFYCLFTLQNFREVTTFLDVDSIKEEKSSELESVLDTAKYALLYGVVCLVALRDFGSHRYLETPEIVEW